MWRSPAEHLARSSSARSCLPIRRPNADGASFAMLSPEKQKQGAHMVLKSLAAAAAALTGVVAFASAPASAGQTFDAVKAKGYVQCAVNTGLAGFSFSDSQG